MLLIFETHPVQYRAPLYRVLQSLCPDQFEVIYGTDRSVHGWRDAGFGRNVAWDEPLCDGYPNRVLNNLVGDRLEGFTSLNGRGVHEVIAKLRPSAVMLTSLRYRFDFRAICEARRHGCKIWLRLETQDRAFQRKYLKGLVRGLIYRMIYSQIDHAFWIGECNRIHLLSHGIREARLSRAPYSTPDRFRNLTIEQKSRRRQEVRAILGFPDDCTVLSFFGKFIPKKNPKLVLEAAVEAAASGLPSGTIGVLMVGSGPLEAELRTMAEELARSDISVRFPGFVNQLEIAAYYLASDIVVLPSRREGETWGLVVNEGLQAGCSVVVSDAVGCAPEFSNWKRFRVAPEGSVRDFANAIRELASYPRSFDWCRPQMQSYSIEVAAAAIASRIHHLVPGTSQAFYSSP